MEAWNYDRWLKCEDPAEMLYWINKKGIMKPTMQYAREIMLIHCRNEEWSYQDDFSSKLIAVATHYWAGLIDKKEAASIVIDGKPDANGIENYGPIFNTSLASVFSHGEPMANPLGNYYYRIFSSTRGVNGFSNQVYGLMAARGTCEFLRRLCGPWKPFREKKKISQEAKELARHILWNNEWSSKTVLGDMLEEAGVTHEIVADLHEPMEKQHTYEFYCPIVDWALREVAGWRGKRIC